MKKWFSLLILYIVLVACSSLLDVPTMPVLATTITPLPSRTLTKIVFPATWTPTVTPTPAPTQTSKPTSTPYAIPTIPVAFIRTFMAKDGRSSGSGNSSSGGGSGVLTVEGSECQPTGYGWVHIVGTVRNGTGGTAYLLQMRGTLFDSSKHQINTNTGYADSDKIFPGKTSTFKILVADPDNKMSTCSLDWEHVYWQ